MSRTIKKKRSKRKIINKKKEKLKKVLDLSKTEAITDLC